MNLRTVLLPLVAALSLGLLAGCGADGEPETPTRSGSAPVAILSAPGG